MSRELFVITPKTRARIIEAVRIAPEGTRVEMSEAKRSLEANAKMWACLTDVARQKTHLGRTYTTDQWKALFLNALGHEVEFIPSLNGSTFFPYGHRSSNLSKGEMSELIEFILKWGADNGVVFHEPEMEAA
jgi:NinB protein